MAYDMHGASREKLLSHMGLGRPDVEKKIREDPVALAMFEVAVRVITDLTFVNSIKRK